MIGRVLGEGGFGITYLGVDTNLERRVAIKEYFPISFVKREVSVTMNVTCYTAEKQSFYEKGREQFLMEARTMAKLDKIPEIVQVLDFFSANNTAYIVMEFLEGNTLKDLTAQQGRIPAKNILAMLAPVLKAMEAMHSIGIIHRDISPDNLMVLKNGEIKLMDFGCARDLGDGRTMTTMLKQGFAPKEQYSGYDQGPWTDVYALCATVYYCLTGKIPPAALDRVDNDTDPLIPPTKLGATLTPAQESALLKGLAVSKNKRWQSARELYDALYVQDMIEDEKKDSQPPKVVGLSKQVKVMIGGAACFMVIASAGLAFWNPAPSVSSVNIGSNIQQEESSSPIQNKSTESADGTESMNKVPWLTDTQQSSSAESDDEVYEEAENNTQTMAQESTQTTTSDSAPTSDSAMNDETQGETETPTESSTQTTTQEATQATTPSTKAEDSTTSASKPQETEPTPEPAPTTASNPTMEELESQADAALDNNQFSQAADSYRQMNSLGYISSSQLAEYLRRVGDDADYYWVITDYGNNSSPYVKIAFELFTEAANMGNTLAYSNIAYSYDYGHYVSIDKAKACEWWTKLANTGDGPSCYFVAQYYASGDGVPQDTQKAIEWLNKCFAYGASYVESDAQALLDKLQGS